MEKKGINDASGDGRFSKIEKINIRLSLYGFNNDDEWVATRNEFIVQVLAILLPFRSRIEHHAVWHEFFFVLLDP